MIEEKDKLNIIVDSSFYFSLEEESSAFCHYVFLALADLPNIRVIFPSIVADWEIMGGLTDPSGNFYQVRDFDDIYNDKKKIRENLFSLCNRVTIDKNGSLPNADKDKHPNLWVLQTTAEQKKIKKAVQKFKQLESFEDIKKFMGADIGEKACMEIAQQLPWEGEVLFLCNDIKFAKEIFNTNLPLNDRHYPITHSKNGPFLGTIAGMTKSKNDRNLNLRKHNNLCISSYFADYLSRQFNETIDLQRIVINLDNNIEDHLQQLSYLCGVRSFIDVEGNRQYTKGLDRYLSEGLKEIGWKKPSVTSSFNASANLAANENPLPNGRPRPILRKI